MEATVKEITTLVAKMSELKDANYKRMGYEEPMYSRPVKVVDYAQTPLRHSMDFKTYQSEMKKRAKYEKTKPGNARVMDYGEDEECRKVDILQDEIFLRGDQVTDKKEEVKIDELTTKKFFSDIDTFLKKKRIILSEVEIEMIRKRVEDPLFERAKFVKYSKTTQMISQLNFIQKMVDDTYQVIFPDEEGQGGGAGAGAGEEGDDYDPESKEAKETKERNRESAAATRASMVDKKKKYVSKKFFK